MIVLFLERNLFKFPFYLSDGESSIVFVVQFQKHNHILIQPMIMRNLTLFHWTGNQFINLCFLRSSVWVCFNDALVRKLFFFVRSLNLRQKILLNRRLKLTYDGLPLRVWWINDDTHTPWSGSHNYLLNLFVSSSVFSLCFFSLKNVCIRK